MNAVVSILERNKRCPGIAIRLAALFLFFAGPAAGDASRVELRVETASRFVHEPFSVRLEVEGDEPLERPRISDSSTLTLRGIRPLRDANGFRIDLVAEQSGILTLPPFPIQAGDTTLETPPLRIGVSAPRVATEMDLFIEFDQTEVVVDQPVRMKLRWKSEVPFERCQELELNIPILRDGNWDVYLLDPGVSEAERIGLPVNGQRVIGRLRDLEGGARQIEVEWMLVPRRAVAGRPVVADLRCALLSGPGRVVRYPSYFDNHFFYIPSASERFERVFLSVSHSALRVRALPESGRSQAYAGLVGPFGIDAWAEPQQSVVGQPMLLHVKLSGLPFARHLAPLPAAAFDALRGEFRISPEPIRDEIGATFRHWTYALRPLRAGTRRIPALVVQSFDPARDAWRMTRTDPLPVEIGPDGERTTYIPYDAGPGEVKTPATGIRENRHEPLQVMYMNQFLLFFSRHAWLFWILPPLLYGIARPWLRRRERCRTDPVYARAVRAYGRFLRAVRTDEETAWRRYLAERMNLSEQSVTYASVRAVLHERNVPEELREEIRERFEHADRRSYASDGRSAGQCRRVDSAGSLVRRIEKALPLPLLLLCLLCPQLVFGEGVLPGPMFEQAIGIADTRPDEARPLFVRAALGFEEEEQWLNAGNSWFFAGENGRALANYLAASRRNPFDRSLREQITFIRAQRPERFMTEEKPSSEVRNAWRQFGQWSASIRFGLLTLLWLLGWGALFVCRWTGREIPRTVWAVAFGIALIPAASLLYSSFQQGRGVVLQQVEARLGPGYAYDPAYDAPIAVAAEFDWIERRGDWVHARFPDGNRGWIPASSCTDIQ